MNNKTEVRELKSIHPSHSWLLCFGLSLRYTEGSSDLLWDSLLVFHFNQYFLYELETWGRAQIYSWWANSFLFRSQRGTENKKRELKPCKRELVSNVHGYGSIALPASPAHSVFLQSTSSHSSYHSPQIWIITILIFLSGDKTLAMLSRKLWLR